MNVHFVRFRYGDDLYIAYGTNAQKLKVRRAEDGFHRPTKWVFPNVLKFMPSADLEFMGEMDKETVVQMHGPLRRDRDIMAELRGETEDGREETS